MKSPSPLPIANRQNAVVTAACRALESEEPAPDLGSLARRFGLSRFQFHRLLSRNVGLTPKAYALAHRDKRVRSELSRSGTVTDAFHAAGFGSSSRFYEKAGGLLGMKPRRFRSGGTGETIRFGVGECSLGSILVAGTSRGVCAIFLGNDPGRLVRELQDRFPRASLKGGEREFERWMARAVALVDRPATSVDLPLDIRGTAFQRRVWSALQRIPPGRTASYSEIARRIGSPSAVRAVATACASNRIAIGIPCHRVVRTDGSLSGYRWGVARKKELLERESRGAVRH